MDDASRRLAPGESNREIEQGFIFDDPARLDSAARGQNDLWLGVVDAGRKLLGGEAPEHHRVDGADARACKHGDDRLGDHRHIDENPVARLNPEIAEDGAERRRLVEQLTISEGAFRRSDGAVVVERDPVAAAGLDMPVERVEAGVQAGVGEPAAVDASVRVENALGLACPGDLARRLGPEGLRIGAPAIIGLMIAAGHRFAPFGAKLGRGLVWRANCRASSTGTQRRPTATFGQWAVSRLP